MQDDRYPFAPPPLPGDTARPHRRHRSHNRGGARPGPQASQAPVPNQSQNQNRPQARPAGAPANDRTQVPAPQREGGARRHRRRGGSQNQTPVPVQNAPRARQAPATVQNPPQPQRPVNAANAPRPQQPRRAPAAPARSEDPGLPLISRRPPKQKFANFEEYIAAHGGVTAPLPGDEAAPQQSPDPE